MTDVLARTGLRRMRPRDPREPHRTAAVQAATTVPLALLLLVTWLVVLRHALGPAARLAVPVIAVLCAAAALVPAGLQVAALLVLVAVVVLEVDGRRGAPA